RRRHTRFSRDWSSDVCSSDLALLHQVTESISFCLAAHVARSNSFFLYHVRRRERIGHHHHRDVPILALHCWMGGHLRSSYFHSEIGRASCRDRVWISGGTTSV